MKPNSSTDANGLSKGRAFEYNDGIGESLALLIPDIYGRNGSYFFVEDQNSESYKALANSGDNQMANQLANYTYAYIGDGGAAYYAGAIIVFLFVVGIFLVDKKWLWWVLPLCVLSILLSWGANFSSFNYFMFDYFPAYNKFRSVTFAVIITLFLMPLLGMLGLEKLFELGWTNETKKKLLMAFGVTGGLCLLVILLVGMSDYTRTGESQLPAWFSKALQSDRKGMARADAFRSIGFILPIFIILYFNLVKRISENVFFGVLIFFVTIDLSMVDKRFLTKNNYVRKHETPFAKSASDDVILQDKSYYRVYNLRSPWNEAGTSYLHHSIGGYHGAKIRRVQDLYDSCITQETQQMIANLQKGNPGFENCQALNMLNAKYIVYGPDANNVLQNPAANGNAWFVKRIEQVSSPTEELKKIDQVNTKEVAVIDNSKFKVADIKADSAASIKVLEFDNPKYLKYESQSSTDGLAVFSEIYYPKGWHAFIDGKESDILRADYVLRALAIPAGKHTIEFKFEPKPYTIGNKVTFASSWAVLLIVLGCFGWSLKKNE
ncbi:MAG TPA: hypothetical protein DGG95_03765 [Cytophagales bacterium]|nr:hypothetical protein [Cytophagales bacterium]